jgi:hypothetical protein
MELLTPELLHQCFENGEISNAYAMEIVANFLHNIATAESEEIKPNQLDLNTALRSPTKDIEEISEELEHEQMVLDQLILIGKIIVSKAGERSVNNSKQLEQLESIMKDLGIEN